MISVLPGIVLKKSLYEKTKRLTLDRDIIKKIIFFDFR